MLFFNVALGRIKDEDAPGRWAELLSDSIYFFKLVTPLHVVGTLEIHCTSIHLHVEICSEIS